MQNNSNTAESLVPEQAVIMVVDDNPDSLTLLSDILSEQSFQVRQALNGRLALAAVKQQPPDLFILDIRMPEMDGFELCRQLKNDDLTRNVPVIFISGLDNSDDKIKAFEIGGQDYITKPFEDTEVLARVKTHIALRKKEIALQMALDEVQQLKGILPICCLCKQIRDDKGYWQQVEHYISEHSDVKFSHGYCPACYEKEMMKLDNFRKTKQ
jgi:PleD family two-component response regulator